LLHPPLLDEVGLASALQWYVEGFSERSKIATRLELPQDLASLSKEVELSVFRVVQECLTNIHRHANSPTARICITQDTARLKIQIEDEGEGISTENLAALRSSARTGVGVRGMRERLRQLGGTLHVEPNSPGTRVTAILPITRDTVTKTEEQAVGD
jgi:two-component system, NarL family, sensor kinase